MNTRNPMLENMPGSGGSAVAFFSALGLVAAAGIWAIAANMPGAASVKPSPNTTIDIRPVVEPKPTPVPQKPVIEPPKEEPKMVVAEPEKVEPKQEPPQTLTTANRGPGDGGGLPLGDNKSIFGPRGDGAVSKVKSEWSAFARVTSQQMMHALHKSEKTRKLIFDTKVKVWLNDAGRIIKVVVEDPAFDAPLREVLVDTQISQFPPESMPQPIVLRVRAQQPKESRP